ncbi:MAG: phosphatidate cytidylyltransferase [Clostridia bacterium]|nr:phosphatidate cytidylyltransferase [Clostridia bacterium]
MKVRLLTSLGILIFGLPLLLLSEFIVYPIALGVLSCISAWELLRVFGLHKKYVVCIPVYLVSALLPFFSSQEFISAERHNAYILVMALTLFSLLIWLAAVAVFSRGSISYRSCTAVFMAVTYVTVSFTSLSLLRYMELGVYFFELVFISAWMCDSFAYFTGRLFGKHKLAPELSPKKTVEGSLGGVAFSIIGCLLYGLIIELIEPSLDANYIMLAVIGVVGAFVAQVGDLWASLIKREYGVKDYSRLLPGHGGIMDRFDSILAVSTVIMVICIFAPPFVAAA